MNGLDSKFIPYPCRTCGKATCNNKYCLEWKDWFYARWSEVTRKLRR